MGMGMCLNCGHCDPSRTNDLDQVRCKLFHTFVNTSNRCEKYIVRNLSLNLDDLPNQDEGRCDDVK